MNRATCFTTVFLFLPSYALAGIPNPETQAFLNATGARAMFDQRDRMVALYGVPMATNPPPSQSTSSAEFEAIVDDFIDDFVDEHADAFGVPGVQLTPMDNTITIRNGKFRVRKYALVATVDTETLPVHGTVVTIPALIMPDREQRIPYVGIELIPVPESFAAQTVDASEAVNLVANMPEYSQFTFDNPEKVLYEDPAQTVHRAWRFMGTGSGGDDLFFVSVADGQLLHAANLVFGAGMTGRVTGFGTDLSPDLCEATPPCQQPEICPPHPCHRADGPTNCPVEFGIPGARVTGRASAH
jgi:hypothetical protein